MKRSLTTIHDPALRWLAQQLRWERTLDALRLRHAVVGSPKFDRERPAA
jgi:hypothetical protein